MQTRLSFAATITWLCLVLSANAAAQLVRQSYEAEPALEAADLLPRVLLRSGNHHVANEVELAGHTVTFRIESDFGLYRPRSISLAVLRIHEIGVLAQAVDQFRRANVRVGEQLRGRLEVGAESFVDILTSPFSTASNVVGQFSSNVGKTVEELGDFPDPRAKTRTGTIYQRFEPDDPVVAAHKRSIGRQLGLDVYSSNPRVQDFLNTVAVARSSGHSSAGVLSVSLPRKVRVRIAGGRVDTAIDGALYRMSTHELAQYNEGRLAALGVARVLRAGFLAQPALSPRHRTAIVAYLDFLRGVAHPEALIEAALDARDEVGALSVVAIARMLARYHDTVSPLRELLPAGRVLLAVSDEQTLVIALPYDLLYWNAQSDRTFAGVADYAAARGYRRRVLLTTGVLTPRARRQLAQRGYQIHERYLLNGD